LDGVYDTKFTCPSLWRYHKPLLMKFRPSRHFSLLSFSLLITCYGFSQSNFTEWIKEIEIEGQKVQVLRVPENEITMSRAKYDVAGVQKQLERCFKEYNEGKKTYKSTIEANLDFLRVNVPDWPISYYEQELKAYDAYNTIWEVRDRERVAQRAARYSDSIRLAKQVAGYHFINKPSVYLKAKPAASSMTMATLYHGSYVEYLGKIENSDFIAIHAGTGIGYTGYIMKDDIVDSLAKLNVTDEEMVRLKGNYYCKIQESSAYGAKVQKIADSEMVAETKTQSADTRSRRVYYTGPRGGCYYINSNGNKTYVDHSYCR
jgi:hypothetical protein